MTLKETVFHDEGKTTITEKNFVSKKEIFNQIKKIIPNNKEVIWALNIYDECSFYYHGLRRKFEITD